MICSFEYRDKHRARSQQGFSFSTNSIKVKYNKVGSLSTLLEYTCRFSNKNKLGKVKVHNPTVKKGKGQFTPDLQSALSDPPTTEFIRNEILIYYNF